MHARSNTVRLNTTKCLAMEFFSCASSRFFHHSACYSGRGWSLMSQSAAFALGNGQTATHKSKDIKASTPFQPSERMYCILFEAPRKYAQVVEMLLARCNPTAPVHMYDYSLSPHCTDAFVHCTREICRGCSVDHILRLERRSTEFNLECQQGHQMMLPWPISTHRATGCWRLFLFSWNPPCQRPTCSFTSTGGAAAVMKNSLFFPLGVKFDYRQHTHTRARARRLHGSFGRRGGGEDQVSKH